MTKKNIYKILLFILLIIFLVFLDQASKTYMFEISNRLLGYTIKPFKSDFLVFTYVENHGGIFGVFQGYIKVFTIFSTILILYLVYAEMNKFLKYNVWIQIGICFIIAGGIGNMYDRIYRGYVIDMINFQYIWRFIFNIADMYIHIGIYIILINYIYNNFIRKEKK